MTIRIPTPRRGEDSAELNPDREKLKLIVSAISGAFVWADTAEGHDFWGAVGARLQTMATDAGATRTPPPLPEPPARPSSLAAACDVRDWLDDANGIDVERHDEHEHNAPEWSLYLLCPFGARREWIADYEIGTNDDQYTAEEAEALAFDYAERLFEAFPQLRAHGINPKG